MSMFTLMMNEGIVIWALDIIRPFATRIIISHFDFIFCILREMGSHSKKCKSYMYGGC